VPRVCQPPTVQARASVVRRFAEFTGAYPWQWRADDADAFFSKLLSGSEPKADSTVRGISECVAFVLRLRHRRAIWMGVTVR